MNLDLLIKELQKINSDYFVWMKAYNKLEIGKGYSPPAVFVRTTEGLQPITVHLEPEIGVVIEGFDNKDK